MNQPPTPKSKNLSKYKVHRILVLYKQGFSIEYIALEVGLSVEQIKRVLP